MLVVPVAAFMPQGAGAVVVYSASLAGSDGAFDGLTFVQYLASSVLLSATGSHVSVEVLFHAFPNGSTAVAYFGRCTGSYSFTGDQVQLTWAGNGTLNAGASVVDFTSDVVALGSAYDHTQNYALAVQITGSGTYFPYDSTQSALHCYYKVGADAATTAKTGYNALGPNDELVKKITIS